MPLRKIDMAVGIVVALVGAFALTQALQLRFYQEGVPGPGFFPSVLAVALIAGGLLLTVTRATKPDSAFEEVDRPSRSEAGRSVGVWVATLVAVLLVDLMGFLLAMVLLVAAVLLGIERHRSLGTVTTIVLIPLLAYVLFAVLLQVPLPTGFFGD